MENKKNVNYLQIELFYLSWGILGIIFSLLFQGSYAVFPAIGLGVTTVFFVRKNVVHKDFSPREIKTKRIISVTSLLVWGISCLITYLFIDTFKDGLWFIFSSYFFLVIYSIMYLLILNKD